MTKEVRIFIIILAVNAALALVYLIAGLITRRKKSGADHFLMNFMVMLLCPVCGALFFAFGALFRALFMHREVDLADVVFSKERVKTAVHADEERESNIVPMEEALVVSDTASLRQYMLNVLRGDISDSLHVVAQALNNEDSETAHYAASVLSDKLNEFRLRVQTMYAYIMELDAQEHGGTPAAAVPPAVISAEQKDSAAPDTDAEGPEASYSADKTASIAIAFSADSPESVIGVVDMTDRAPEQKKKAPDIPAQPVTAQPEAPEADIALDAEKLSIREEKDKTIVLLVHYMEKILSQNVFTSLEQESYTRLMNEVCGMLYRDDPSLLTIDFYENAVMRLTDIKEYELAEGIALRGLETFPDELSMYTGALRLYFMSENSEKFFEILESLKARHDIVIDKKTLELIHTFTQN